MKQTSFKCNTRVSYNVHYDQKSTSSTDSLPEMGSSHVIWALTKKIFQPNDLAPPFTPAQHHNTPYPLDIFIYRFDRRIFRRLASLDVSYDAYARHPNAFMHVAVYESIASSSAVMKKVD